MAFKHFRRHQKLYLILGLGAMIFSLVTFSVGSTISTLARSEEAGSLGTFVDSRGETITITRDDYMRARLASNEIFAPSYKTEQKDSVVEHVILSHEARLAGIHVSDAMLARSMTEAGLTISEAQYREFVSRLGVTVKRFEAHFREMVAIRILRAMRQEGDLITSREVYDRFAEENERVHVSYTAFPFEKFSEGLDPESISDEELRAYYDSEMPAPQKQREYSTPERFRFEAAYLDFAAADLSEFESLLEPGDEPSDEEIERYYQVNVARYRTQEPAPENGSDAGEAGPTPGENDAGDADEPPSGGGGADSGGFEAPRHGPSVARPADSALAFPQDDEGASGGDGPQEETTAGDQAGTPPESAEADEAEWRKMTLEEARPRVRKDLLLKKLLEKLQEEYNAERADLQREAAESSDEAEGDQSAGDEGDEGDDPPAASPESDEDKAAALAEKLKDRFRALAAKYHLAYASYDDGLTRQEIESLDPIGDSNLQYLVSSLKVNDIRVRAPLEEQRYGCVLRMSEKIAPEPKPFEEVRDSLREPFVIFRERQRAEEAARTFREKVTSLAREAKAGEIEKIRAEALRIAENRISAQAIEDEAEKQKLRDQVVAGEEGQIEGLINEAMADHIEDVARSMSLAVEQLEPFPKNFYFSAPYRRLSAGPRKYLTSYEAGLNRAEPGTVTDVLSDRDGKCSYVAWVTDVTRPSPEEMGPGDRRRARSNVERTHFIARGLFARQKDPQALKRLEVEYQLRLNKKKDGDS